LEATAAALDLYAAALSQLPFGLSRGWLAYCGL
jgi:hypothetical protein